MATVTVVVTLDTTEHSFVENAEQARALIENILERDPRFNINHMAVNLDPKVIHERDTMTENAGDELHNIFKRDPPGLPPFG